MASSSHYAAAVDPAVQHNEEDAGSERVGWEGSDVSPANTDWLRCTRHIPVEVECRTPGDEVVPTPGPGEFVVFVSHFERGFWPPVSDFTRHFFNHFGLQPHHLPANAILTLSAFITCRENYLGLWPSVDLWAKYFMFRPQVLPDKDNPDALSL